MDKYVAIAICILLAVLIFRMLVMGDGSLLMIEQSMDETLIHNIVNGI